MSTILRKIRTSERDYLFTMVYHLLRQAVITGELEPGERLVERNLAKQLGVSRTPVREAIRKLELEGLVKHIPNKGVFVAMISPKDVWDIYNIRSVLEGLACRLAAINITLEEIEQMEQIVQSMEAAVPHRNTDLLNELHMEYNKKLYSIARNPRLFHLCCNLMDYILGFTRIGYSVPGRLHEATREHRLLFEAIKDGNGSEAERIARKHVENSCNAYFVQSALIKDEDIKEND